MAVELTPKQAGEIADSTYPLRLSNNMLDAAVGTPSARNDFDIVNGQRLTGVTGIGPASSTTGFGYIAFGKPGARQGECVVAIRGTEKSSADDWLTNFRMAGVSGPGGYSVHAGFWNLAAGLIPQIQQALQGRNPALIHIVGHSLGGATATLVADVVHRNRLGRVKLYTFGAPRAGVERYAEALTHSLGSENIRRAYHHTDPVPMVPVFPYAHAPYQEEACWLQGCGKLISIDAHLMPTYLSSVGDQTWGQLRVVRPPSFDTFAAADHWLAAAARVESPSIMFSATALRLILSAFRWILRRVGEMIGYALLGGATIIDYLAKALYRGALQSIDLARSVRNMVGALFRFTGRTLAAGLQLTEALIQYVLELMFRMVASTAIRAINQLP